MDHLRGSCRWLSRPGNDSQGTGNKYCWQHPPCLSVIHAQLGSNLLCAFPAGRPVVVARVEFFRARKAPPRGGGIFMAGGRAMGFGLSRSGIYSSRPQAPRLCQNPRRLPSRPVTASFRSRSRTRPSSRACLTPSRLLAYSGGEIQAGLNKTDSSAWVAPREMLAPLPSHSGGS